MMHLDISSLARNIFWFIVITFFIDLLTINGQEPMNVSKHMHEESNDLHSFRLLHQNLKQIGEKLPLVANTCKHPNFCELEKTSTTGRVCENHGMCNFDPDLCSYWCTCEDGYSGIKCQRSVFDHPPAALFKGRGLGPSEYDDNDLVVKVTPTPGEPPPYNETLFGKSDFHYPEYDSVAETSYEDSYGISEGFPINNLNLDTNKYINSTSNNCQILHHDDNECTASFACLHGKCHKYPVTDTLHGEVLGMHCTCDEGWIGERCNLCCDLDCGDHGQCMVNSTYGKFCACQWGFYGDSCSEHEPLKGPPPAARRWILVAAGVLALLMALAMPCLLYYMWRQRVPIVLKIIKFMMPFEEKDGRTYDAFISYKSASRDESFVVHHVYPKLEMEHNFKLCLHFRDFTPGETIANNIIRAIQNSRRTILILTPSYIESEWARFEYQVAQHEMLKLRHRIIPIVLDDISKVPNVDENLKAILNAVTYIEYPGIESSNKEDRFWQKVILSLPKKRLRPTEESTSSELRRNSSITTNGLNNQSTEGTVTDLITSV